MYVDWGYIQKYSPNPEWKWKIKITEKVFNQYDLVEKVSRWPDSAPIGHSSGAVTAQSHIIVEKYLEFWDFGVNIKLFSQEDFHSKKNFGI